LHLAAAVKENSNKQEDRKGAHARSQPEAGPIAGYGGPASRREEVDRATRKNRSDEHSHAVGQKRKQSLGRAAEVWRRFLIGVQLPRHEEEIETYPMQQDRRVKQDRKRDV